MDHLIQERTVKLAEPFRQSLSSWSNCILSHKSHCWRSLANVCVWLMSSSYRLLCLISWNELYAHIGGVCSPDWHDAKISSVSKTLSWFWSLFFSSILHLLYLQLIIMKLIYCFYIIYFKIFVSLFLSPWFSSAIVLCYGSVYSFTL